MNHIQKIIDETNKTPDTAHSARFFRLGILALCAIATEQRRLNNIMEIGQPDDLVCGAAQEPGTYTELDEALSRVSTSKGPKWEQDDEPCMAGLLPSQRDYGICDACIHTTCAISAPFPF